ncbi:hypothetical protein GLOIN_2v1762423 [Rhizophagus irregularis DAOM 181602=DAOM 197198]|uniref:Uncharacterized protein n=1 Tax=Rhizophagus irregularis (strain DAOM 181602 / DAOM 197198 / MUCL 43194) TaxID=747089 RepID=A0A2P4QX39_RHIID|nr:hypothetical protein GLOIN_2v1762423 [Rhizophagus irregularis DAOM 181602=DAOM 197198]POG82226.1 hypothetical protein GLOIN_2v1762423 [Rhizophagus irregularis DAOM 181602=DAOM 197198]GET57533.1 hypothetical protein GLOIN_2v1762423 [Rhizophagus irregularis DAOM 181602=DAOM 197198]|eukprot:XP_025189092.1 hypothetical protein GLOIN_2v1762423 [Rhizophagus irregularis DAOM 181602=DAOM 197198]
MYHQDMIKLDRQDDSATYHAFCSGNLQNCYDIIKEDMQRIFVYLFIIGELIDSYLNREITPLERIKMSMTAFFFLQLWKKHIANMSEKYSDFISLNKNFLADQRKSVCEGYHFDYNVGDINSRNLATLCTWPSDAEITLTIEYSYELASELANALDIDTIQHVNPLILQPYILIKKQNSEISAEIELNSKINEFSEINREISDVIDQASKHAASSNDIFDSLNSEENTDDRIHQKQIISILNVTKTYNNEKQTHEYHEAYNSRPIKRQYRVYDDKQTNTGSINPNKASQIVSHFTNNNDPTIYYIKPREK